MTGGADLLARLARAGQEPIVHHLRSVSGERRARLLAQLASIDLELVADLRAGRRIAPPPSGEIEPVPYAAFATRARERRPRERGEEELRADRVAFVLLAGGQASRLRWDGPKGAYPIGPATRRTLFQILAEKLLRAGRRHGAAPRLAVTTSPGTNAAIREHFAAAGNHGIPADRVRFAVQASVPALDEQGHLLLEGPDTIFASPDGHGGAATALETSGILQEWEASSVTTVCTFQVDNPALQVVDPDFIGRLLLGSSPVATKVVLKTDPAERVGVVARSAGRPALLEYSEISKERAEARDPDGQLTFRLGSIAVHAFRLDFLRAGLRGRLPFHKALKEIPCVDAEGRVSRPKGLKFERFLFDLFPLAPSVAVVEALREREYAPLKNAEGADSPEAVRAALDSEYRRWYREAGKRPPPGPRLEISPLVAEGPEDLLDS
ncbi:MAG: UTP--glucose-1-phosphate uridylyltransferase [Planctomycetota bacterium]